MSDLQVRQSRIAWLMKRAKAGDVLAAVGK